MVVHAADCSEPTEAADWAMHLAGRKVASTVAVSVVHSVDVKGGPKDIVLAVPSDIGTESPTADGMVTRTVDCSADYSEHYLVYGSAALTAATMER
jgi:hypothetical protein